MAATLILIAALAMSDPVVAAPVDTVPADSEAGNDAALFDAATGCAAYHVFMASTAAPQSDAAKLAEEKAVLFLMASYAKMPQDKPELAETKIEETVKGLFEDSASLEPERHKREIADLGQACIEFEPKAQSIVDASGLAGEAQ